jgi:hypothetical protein
VLTGLLVLAGCGSGKGADAAPSASPSMSDAQIQTIINQLVQCIRDNGAPGMPDVKVQNGRVVDPDENAVDDATKQNFDSALTACASIKNKLPPSVFGEGSDGQDRTQRQLPTAEDLPALRKFAQCMRDNGIPEWPDPKADGTFPIVGTALESEGKSPRIVNAAHGCQQYWSGGITFS